MSLFGDDENAIPSPSPPISEDSLSPPNAQDVPLSPFAPLPDPDDPADEDFQPSSPEPQSTSTERRVIKPQSWRRYTEADREVAASLENIESADLAVHLYNAHCLKRRLRRPAEQLEGIKDWQNKDQWLKKGEDLQYRDPLTGELETELVPSKLWTAWPLPPKRLPRDSLAANKIDDSEDGWYIGSSMNRASGEVMREEILALFLRTAKRNWSRRQNSAEDFELHADRGDHFDPSSTSSRSDTETDHESRSKKTTNVGQIERKKRTKGHSRLFSSGTEDERFSGGLDRSIVDTEDSRASQTSDDMHADRRSIRSSLNPARRGLLDVQQPETEADFLADDDEARRILGPSVNSLVSRIDKLALAVRRNRLNHVGDGSNRSGSESDYVSDRQIPAPRARRLAKHQVHSNVSKETKRTQPTTARSLASRPYKPSQDEPNAANSDTAPDFGADSESGDVDPLDAAKQTQKARARSASSNSSRRSNVSSNPEVRRGVGLMDWSELLGLAAIAGFDKRVIARTTQRCATLFGEKMNQRTFNEDLATQPLTNPIPYTPSMIPGPDEMRLAPKDAASKSDIVEDESRPMVKRPYFDPGSLRCPHTGCPGSRKEYSGSSRLTEHVRRKHGYDPRTNDSDNEERTHGGVHIDGYLQPIWAKPGWLGHGRAKSEATDNEVPLPKRKRQRTESRPTSTVTSAYTTQDEQEDQTPAARLKTKKTCTNCSRRKKLCDGDQPCGRCRSLGEAETCAYRTVSVRAACLNCRRMKQKCDYGRPCARCRVREATCLYPS